MGVCSGGPIPTLGIERRPESGERQAEPDQTPEFEETKALVMEAVEGNLKELLAIMQSGDPAAGAKAIEAIAQMKGKSASAGLAEFLRTAPPGLLATRAALVLEKRKHRSTLPILHEVYQARPDLAEDIIPILSAMEDPDGVLLVAENLRTLCGGPARLSALAYLVKCADAEGLCGLLLPIRLVGDVPAARDDLDWAIRELLGEADDETLERVGLLAEELGPQAVAMVAPYMPAKGELEIQAPTIAQAFVAELVRMEQIDLTDDNPDALVDTLANAICEARSPKSLIRDVERILLDHPAVDELYADRDDIRKAFAAVTS